jgi:two-component sensor histidine kinase
MAAFMTGVLDSLQANVFLCDPALNIVSVNALARKSFLALRAEVSETFGADVEQLTGFSLYRFFQDPASVEAILSDPALLPHTAEIAIGTTTFRARIDALRGPQGALTGYSVVCEDITQLRAAEAESRAAMLQRETLQSEVHRRVRNSLEMVSDLVRLESDVPTGEALAPAWAPAWVERLRAISRVHELIYASDDVSRVDLDAYVRELVKEIVAEHAEPEAKIKIETAVSAEIRDLDLLIDFGLVLGELVANAVKHAFPGGRAGRIRVTARNVDGAVEAVVSDDGVGIPADALHHMGFGRKLVFSMIEGKLKGTMKIESRGTGTACLFSIPTRIP